MRVNRIRGDLNSCSDTFVIPYLNRQVCVDTKSRKVKERTCISIRDMSRAAYLTTSIGRYLSRHAC